VLPRHRSPFFFLSAGLVAAALACLMVLRSGTEDLVWSVAVSGLGGLSTILTKSIDRVLGMGSQADGQASALIRCQRRPSRTVVIPSRPSCW